MARVPHSRKRGWQKKKRKGKSHSHKYTWKERKQMGEDNHRIYLKNLETLFLSK